MHCVDMQLNYKNERRTYLRSRHISPQGRSQLDCWEPLSVSQPMYRSFLFPICHELNTFVRKKINK